MDVEEEDLRTLFPDLWERHVEKLRNTLNSPDQETIDKWRSYTETRKVIQGGETGPNTLLLGLSLSSLKIFANFFETTLGPVLDASFFWGTLSCLLQESQIVDENQASLHNVPHLIKKLAQRANTFNEHCNHAQVVGYPEAETCFEMQRLFVEFLTSSISYIHTESSDQITLIEQFYEKTKDEIDQRMAWIEKQATQHSTTDDNETRLRYHVSPDTNVTRLFDRTEYFAELDRMLLPTAKQTSLVSVALHGLQGVGKTALASTYMERKYRDKIYDVVLWVPSENQIDMRQCFTEIAMKLKLPGARHQTHDENLSLVQEWFQNTECKWLVVYDNVESAEAIRPYWPKATKGSAIITTWNLAAFFNSVSFDLEVTPWTVEDGREFLFFLLKNQGINMDLTSEKEAALSLSARLDGHALSILQIAGLINNSGSSIHDFLNIYLENVTRINGSDDFAKLRNKAFEKLDTESRSLLGVMSFLMPDTIPQELFEKGVEHECPDGLKFCSEKYDLWHVLSTLNSLYLIKRNERALSIHRVTQMQFKSSLTRKQLQQSFDRAVTLLYNVLPKQNIWKGQLYREWETYNQYLHHVYYLKSSFMEQINDVNGFTATLKFCKLLVQYQRYLYEVNALAELKSFSEVSLELIGTLEDGPDKDDLQADIMSYQANRAESLGDAEKAISLNKEVLRIRKEHNKEDLLGHVTNNIGYCYNTANDHETSQQWFRESYDWWCSNGKQVPSFVRTNMARCMIYRDNFAAARVELAIAIPQLREEKDWAMLAYAYFVQGIMSRRQRNYQSAEASFREADISWMKGDEKRLHPFYGACIYKIGVCCLDQGKVPEAIESFNKSIEVTDFHKESMPVEHARNMFKFSEALSQDSCNDSRDKAQDYKDKAKTYLRKKNPDVATWDTEDAYDRLIPVFWR